VTWLARSAVPVPWQRGHTGSVAKKVQAGGTDDVCEWWLVSTLADDRDIIIDRHQFNSLFTRTTWVSRQQEC